MYKRDVQLTQGQNSFTIDGSAPLPGHVLFEMQTGNTVTREKIMKQ